jgi:hypothetical protein
MPTHQIDLQYVACMASSTRKNTELGFRGLHVQVNILEEMIQNNEETKCRFKTARKMLKAGEYRGGCQLQSLPAPEDNVPNLPDSGSEDCASHGTNGETPMQIDHASSDANHGGCWNRAVLAASGNDGEEGPFNTPSSQHGRSQPLATESDAGFEGHHATNNSSGLSEDSSRLPRELSRIEHEEDAAVDSVVNASLDGRSAAAAGPGAGNFNNAQPTMTTTNGFRGNEPRGSSGTTAAKPQV